MRFSTPAHAWDWWRSLGAPRFVAAPMVDQSELAFRTLCRELGVGLCYTPMLHARLMTEVRTYQDLHFDAGRSAADRPLFGQLAGHDPRVVLAAARLIEQDVDAVDLNFGCPQAIARKGRYGAFLLEEPGVPVSLVETLARELSVPVTAKLRILPDDAGLGQTIELCQQMQEAGAALLCLHGRTRMQNKQLSGVSNWDAIKQLVEAVDIPVIANGGIGSYEDAEACLAHTGAAAVMSSEALLENPALFCRNRDAHTGAYIDQDALAQRYLKICEEQPPSKGLSMSRGHVFKLVHGGLRQQPHLRDEILLTQSTAELHTVCSRLAEVGWTQPRFHTDAFDPAHSWYFRYRQTQQQQPHPPASASSEPSQQPHAVGAHAAPLTRDQAAATALEKRDRKRADSRRRRDRRDASRRQQEAVAHANRLANGGS